MKRFLKPINRMGKIASKELETCFKIEKKTGMPTQFKMPPIEIPQFPPPKKTRGVYGNR